MQSNYIPEGNNTYYLNTTYVYGKVTPLKRLYDNVELNYQRTPIYVDIFCEDTVEIDCSDKYGLDTPSLGKEEVESGWNLATIFANNELGMTDINVQHENGINADPFVSFDGGLKSKSLTDVPFNDTQATQNDVNVSVAGSGRNSMVKAAYTPVPWLIYDVDQDYYRIHFTMPSGWAGVGKTGHVTDTASSKMQNDRMSW